MEIDDLKNIYKEKKASAEFTGKGEYESVMSLLKRSERREWLRNILMTFFMAVAVYLLGGKVLSHKQYDTYTYAGIYLIFAAMGAVFVFVWSSAIVFRKKEVTTPSIQFLEMARRKLARRTVIRRIIIPIYLTAITVGITLVYIEVLSPFEMIYRLLLHLLVIVMIMLVSYIATRRERRRYERVYKPLQEQIERLLNEMNREPD
ncbi:MAG: hypothetical protein JNK43_05005 [Ignavibacteria bacterium]|nr:hypothetical protein [Ignavibacteria bacterium]